MFKKIRSTLVVTMLISLVFTFAAYAASCDDAKTTSEFEACALQDRNIAIGKLRAAYQNVRAGQDEKGKILLLNAQKAWDAYRDAECIRLADSARGGTMRATIELSCVAKLSMERADVLNTNPLTGEIVEPATTEQQSSAVDLQSPVNEIFNVANKNLSSGSSEYYFSDDRLARIFSAGFVSSYNNAAKSQAAEDRIALFDYDVIIQAQDGCPLENLALKQFPTSGGVTIFMATFQSKACWGVDEQYKAYSEVRFQMLEENGRAVIDDIFYKKEDGGYGSVMDDLAAMS